ncbi:helix-turn-helix domain-containing protein [Aestuariivirga litoralis]|uniref:helix-turn-helix domain-containing protein n=1 Tax=Aestuariivirga litoralis TaxID=2650924 RepID=UPI0018C65EF1|nr:helix-turn-helix transcriptional regulator [Aestuariivirga litoralis]MBG1233097.1 helix-turn-helix transcriptional regulator [Aestuariivirga litoralis]
MSDDDLSEAESKAIGQSIREELARKRLTRQHLADLAKISLSTLEKALSGQRPFTLASVVRIEEALKLPLRKARHAQTAMGPSIAPPEMGSYSHGAVSWLEGDYLTLRASFSTAEAIYAYSTSIKWDQALSHLCFHESERQDPQYKQDGFVSVPHQSGYIYLVTNKLGQYRMVMLTRPIISGEMYGLLSTLQSGRASQLTPISTPVVLAPAKQFGTEIEFGVIEASSKVYERYRKLLKRAHDEPFVLFGKQLS